MKAIIVLLFGFMIAFILTQTETGDWLVYAAMRIAHPNTPYTTVALPRPGQAGWMNRHTNLIARAQQGNVEVAFFGDSITEGMNTQTMHAVLGPKAEHFGISGDGTQHLLWRLQHGELNFKAPAPKVAVLLIGTNNIQTVTRLSPSGRHDVFLGVKANVDEIRKQLPDTKVLILGILPREASPNHPIRAEIAHINGELTTLADKKHIFFADITIEMLETDLTLSHQVMSDLVHPTSGIGYTRMFTALKPYIDPLL